jgi:hypothetical protein
LGSAERQLFVGRVCLRVTGTRVDALTVVEGTSALENCSRLLACQR